MQKTVIALWGTSDQGKTTTIRLAYERALQEGKSVSPGFPACKEVKAAIVEIDGVKVGFASQGDVAGLLEENLKPLLKAECGVIVCATHTRGGTVEAVERLEPPYQIQWIEKKGNPLSAHERGNRETADEIIRQVRKAID